VILLVHVFRQLTALSSPVECHIIILTSATFLSVELGTFGVLGKYANSGIGLTVIMFQHNDNEPIEDGVEPTAEILCERNT
jgi:hypothetical protein